MCCYPWLASYMQQQIEAPRACASPASAVREPLALRRKRQGVFGGLRYRQLCCTPVLRTSPLESAHRRHSSQNRLLLSKGSRAGNQGSFREGSGNRSTALSSYLPHVERAQTRTSKGGVFFLCVCRNSIPVSQGSMRDMAGERVVCPSSDPWASDVARAAPMFQVRSGSAVTSSP